MLAPTSPIRRTPCVRRNSAAPATSCQMAAVSFDPSEHPASPPGQYPRKSNVSARYPSSPS